MNAAAGALDARAAGWQVGRVQDRLIFLIGAPRSGTTLLARMLSAHSQIHGRAEPHLITPVAHLGYFGKVQKAPYDQNNVEQAIREVVAEIPRHEAGYLDRDSGDNRQGQWAARTQWRRRRTSALPGTVQ